MPGQTAYFFQKTDFPASGTALQRALAGFTLLLAATAASGTECSPARIESPDHPQALELLLKQARASHTPITLMGSGYSQGNQTCADGAIQVDIKEMNQLITIDIEKRLVTVQAGMTWKRLQQHLAPFGLAVTAMQSYNDFSIGGSLGVNAHGQDLHWNPVSASVESMKVLLTDGRTLPASRTENHELFRALLGSYGLIGIITEVTLRVVPDHTLVKKKQLVSTKQYLQYFTSQLQNNDRLALHSARLSINPLSRFRNMVVINYWDTGELSPPPTELPKPAYTNASLLNLMKSFWLARVARTTLEYFFLEKDSRLSRNQAMAESVDSLRNTVPGTRDILQEYFIPPDRLQEFIDALNSWVSENSGNFTLVNATIRRVNADRDTLLPYAPEDRFAVVLFISLPNSTEAEQAIEKATRRIIDTTLALGGRYYLPYGLYASRSQFYQAYPEFHMLVTAKKTWDKEGRLTNQLYRKYH